MGISGNPFHKRERTWSVFFSDVPRPCFPCETAVAAEEGSGAAEERQTSSARCYDTGKPWTAATEKRRQSDDLFPPSRARTDDLLREKRESFVGDADRRASGGTSSLPHDRMAAGLSGHARGDVAGRARQRITASDCPDTRKEATGDSRTIDEDRIAQRRKDRCAGLQRPVRWVTTEANRLPNGTADAGIVAIPVMRVGERSRTRCKATDTNSWQKPSVARKEASGDSRTIDENRIAQRRKDQCAGLRRRQPPPERDRRCRNRRNSRDACRRT